MIASQREHEFNKAQGQDGKQQNGMKRKSADNETENQNITEQINTLEMARNRLHHS